MNTVSKPSWAPPHHQAAIFGFWEEFRQNTTMMHDLQALIQAHPAMQFGNHYWRPISENGIEFSKPDSGICHFLDVIAWSRIVDEKEALCAINLHPQRQAVVYVTVDRDLHGTGSKMTLLYGSGQVPNQLNVEDRNGKSIRLTLPSRALVIYG